MAVPLASYYAVTLALPLANGAAQSGDAFVKHALVVLVVPPLAIVLACVVHAIAIAFAKLMDRLACVARKVELVTANTRCRTRSRARAAAE
jgi:hypothetical protein